MIAAENGEGEHDGANGDVATSAVLPWNSIAGDVFATPAPAPNAVVTGYVSFTQLLESAIHGIYQHLHILVDLLPRKTDSERKVAIAQFALRTRMLCIRLLAVFDWVNSNGQRVERCAQIVNLLGKQGVQLIDSADKLAELSRITLPNVCLPPFSVYQAVSVLVSPIDGLRLPTCIRERFASRGPLSEDEKLFVIGQLNQLIETRLVSSEIPSRLLKNLRVAEGCLQLRVDNEFEARLTLMSFEPNCPWRLLDLAIIVNDPGAPGSDITLVHRRQLDFLCQFVQNRLLSIEDADNAQPLVVLYNMLHSFCLSLQLELLHDHANQLVRLRYTDAIAVSRQSTRSLSLTYWSVSPHSTVVASSAASSSSSSTALSQSTPQLFSLSVVANDSRPFLLVDHVPALTQGPKHVKPRRLNMYWLLTQTLHCRAQYMLDKLMTSISAVTTPNGIIGGGGAVSLENAITNGNTLRPILRLDLVTPNGPLDQIVEVSLEARRGTLRCTNPLLPRQILSDFDSSVRSFTFPQITSSATSSLPPTFFSSLLAARTVIMLSRLLSSARRLGLSARIAPHFVAPNSSASSENTTAATVINESGGTTAEASSHQALWVPIGIPSIKLSAAFTCSLASSKSGLADVCLHQLDSVGDSHDTSIRPPDWFAINDRRLPTSSGYVCSRLNLDAVLASTYATLAVTNSHKSKSVTTQNGSTDLILAHRQLVVSMSFCQQRTVLANLELSFKRMGFQTAGVAVDWSTGQQSLLLTGVTQSQPSLLSRALETRLLHCRVTWELPRSERWLVSAILVSSVPVPPPATLTTATNVQPFVKSSKYFPLVFHLDPITGGQALPSVAFDRTATLISYTLDSASHLLSLLVPLNSTDKPSPIVSLEIQSQRASVVLRYFSEQQPYTVTVSVSRTPVPLSGGSPFSPSAIVAWHYSLVFGPGSPHAQMRHIFHSWFSRTLDFSGLLLILEETAPIMGCLRNLVASSTLIQLPLAMDAQRLAVFLGGPQTPTTPLAPHGVLVSSAAIIPISPVLVRLIFHGCLAFSVRLLPNKFVRIQHCPSGVPMFTLPPTPDMPNGEQHRALALPTAFVTKILNALTAEMNAGFATKAEESNKMHSPSSIVISSERFGWAISSGRLEVMLANAIAFHSLEVALQEPSAPSNIAMGTLPFTSKVSSVAKTTVSNETAPLVLVNPVVQVTVSLSLQLVAQGEPVFKISTSPPAADSAVPSSPSGGLPPLFPYDCQKLDEYLIRDAEMSVDSSSASSTTRLVSLLRILSQPLPVIRDFLSLMVLALQPESSASCRLWFPLTYAPGRSSSHQKTPITCQSRSRINFTVDLYRNQPGTGDGADSSSLSNVTVRLNAMYDASGAFMVQLAQDQLQASQLSTPLATLSVQLESLQKRAMQQASTNQQTPLFPVLSDIAANMKL